MLSELIPKNLTELLFENFMPFVAITIIVIIAYKKSH